MVNLSPASISNFYKQYCEPEIHNIGVIAKKKETLKLP